MIDQEERWAELEVGKVYSIPLVRPIHQGVVTVTIKGRMLNARVEEVNDSQKVSL
jgi:hypothetical protein